MILLDRARERRVKRQEDRQHAVAGVVLGRRAFLLEKAQAPEAKLAIRAVFQDDRMFSVLMERVREEFPDAVEDSGRPILDALAKLIEDFISDPEKWIKIIMMIVGLFA